MLRDFVPRLYQQTIFATAVNHNTLIVLPTGLGKTALALMMATHRLTLYPNSKILMLAPTKPLCDQHAETFKKHMEIPAEKIVIFTGSVAPEKRGELWKEAQIIISTPQGLENDVINRRINLAEISLLIFDEAHHATKEYSYVWLAQQYDKLSPHTRILALTASPGSDLETIKSVCQNLKIEKLEVRTEDDPDVQPYIQEVKVKWLKVEFPEEWKKVQKYMQDCEKSKLVEMQKLGHCSSLHLTKGELLLLQVELQKKISGGERTFELLRSLSLLAETLKVEHGLELLETQGIQPTFTYFKKIQQEALTSKTKAAKNIVLDPNFKSAFYLVEEILEQNKLENILSPKLKLLKEVLLQEISAHPQTKIIVFTQFRDTAEGIVKELEKNALSTHIFVGQAKKNGLGFSQKEQKEILDQFREGEFNFLIATSVAEEGLDIPKVDKVIFYEPIPSAIRSIQRRGRTGRLAKGEVLVLFTQGTRDEAYRWSSHHKEKRMYRNLEQVKKEAVFLLDEPKEEKKVENKNNLATLDRFIPEDQVVAVLADHREKDNKVVKELIELGVSVKTAQLELADYLVSGKVAVELKKVPDFVASIIDGRLLDQLRGLKQNFSKSALLIEGEEDLYAVRNVHANAIRGMLATIALDFHIPVLYTKNPRDTAALLAVMAKREQDTERDFSYHDHKPHSEIEQLEFFVSSLPGIGVQTAKLLLEHFGTLKKLVNAKAEDFLAIKGIGEKTAERLVKLFEEEYGKKGENETKNL